MNEAAALLKARGLSKTYGRPPVEVVVLTELSVEFRRGDFVAIMGPSGSGKSTLLHLLAGIDSADSGTVEVDGQELSVQTAETRARWRNEKIGFVFQFHHLLPEFTAEENVAMPLRLAGVGRREALSRARDLLASVGLSHRLRHLPPEMSGGELQRTAIARAIARRPPILLADEPTGNLDQENAEEVFRLLQRLHGESGGLVILATHDRDLAERCDKIFSMTPHGLRSSDV
jgi:lipoprotein-releasing system ATP-binding protein